MNPFKSIFKSKKTPTEWKGTFTTDSGMLALWNYDSFKHIHDYDSWDKELCEDPDIIRHIKEKEFVPFNTMADGTFAVTIRLGSREEMNKREKEYLLVPSQLYHIESSGMVCLSGLEHVAGDFSDSILKIELPKGRYTVQVNLIDWNQEPGAVGADGAPSGTALPDMIAYIQEANDSGGGRTEIETFRREDALR